MKDSPLSCDFPETDLENLLDTRVFHTRGARLASPPAKPVVGVSDSSKDMELAVAYICERFIDIRTAFFPFSKRDACCSKSIYGDRPVTNVVNR